MAEDAITSMITALKAKKAAFNEAVDTAIAALEQLAALGDMSTPLPTSSPFTQ